MHRSILPLLPALCCVAAGASEVIHRATVDTAEGVVIGAEAWTGPDDCSAQAVVEYDAKQLGFTIDVRDDVIGYNSPMIWQNDSVELYLDWRPPADRGRATYGPGAVQVIILPELGSGTCRVESNSGGQGYNCRLEGLEARSQRTDDGYRITVTIPAEAFAAHHPLADGLNVAIGINDADADLRESQLMSAGSQRNSHDASGWAPVSLAP